MWTRLVLLSKLDGGGVASGGLRELIPCIARTSVAVGVDGIFMEVNIKKVMLFFFTIYTLLLCSQIMNFSLLELLCCKLPQVHVDPLNAPCDGPTQWV
jgi:2-dehydro-3-deoxyphosphooctonate aldolase (KDO 8-P synthase)